MLFKNFFKNFFRVRRNFFQKGVWGIVLTDFGFCAFLFLILARRFCGAFTSSCSTGGILFFTLFAGGIFLLLNLIRRKLFFLSGAENHGKRLFGAFMRLALFLAAFYAVLTPGSSLLAKFTAFGGMCAVVGVFCVVEFPELLKRFRPTLSPVFPEAVSASKSISSFVSESVSVLEPSRNLDKLGEMDEFEVKTESEEESESEAGLLPFDISQKLERSGTERGEKISGLLRGNFGPNQTRITLFASFCPPLTHVPAVEAFVAEGDGVVETVLALPHGVEFVVRKGRRVPIEDAVVLSFTALEFGDLTHE